jgi:predicted ATPase
MFEDLHWIDSETQALLDSLIESLPTARMLLLANYRPEYQHGWGAKTYYTQLRLDPLPPASAGALLRALLGGMAACCRSFRSSSPAPKAIPFFSKKACAP